MKHSVRRIIVAIVCVLLIFPTSAGEAFACCSLGDIPIVGPVIIKPLEKVPVVGKVIKAVDDGSGAVYAGGKQVVEGAGKVGVGAIKLVKGDKSGWDDIKDGIQGAAEGTILVATAGTVTVLAAADPLIGTLFFGAPSPLQGVAKFIYDTISRLKGKPNCNPQEQINRLMTVPKQTIGDGSRYLGAVSTPAKYLSSLVDGIGAWEPTGCDGSGIGRPVRDAQLSTDGFWTVDLELFDFTVQGVKAPLKRYLRLEIIPGVPAHDSASNHRVVPSDFLEFSGPMIWDKDIDSEHPYGHMEVHPYGALSFGQRAVPPPPPARSGPLPPNITPPAEEGPTSYLVVKGDSLSRIAQRFYGKQIWPPVYCANRSKIKIPDLIFPGQSFKLPLPGVELSSSKCRIPIN